MTNRLPYSTNRRGFLTGLGALFIAAPAIVRVTSIMPVKAIRPDILDDDIVKLFTQINELLDDIPFTESIYTGIPIPTWRMLNQGVSYDK